MVLVVQVAVTGITSVPTDSTNCRHLWMRMGTLLSVFSCSARGMPDTLEERDGGREGGREGRKTLKTRV